MPKERNKADGYREKAYEGDTKAMNNLGVCYERGIGVKVNLEMAFEWYMKAAELGDVYGCFNVGECYYHGKGVEQNAELAFEWYMKAADKGDMQSQSNLDYRNTFHKDHIHPFVLCRDAGYDWEEYDTILNLQMLDANENMSKNAKQLLEWVDAETTPETRLTFLKNHLIPNVDLSLENFREFIDQRRILLRDRIKQLFKREIALYIPSSEDEDDIEEFEDELVVAET